MSSFLLIRRSHDVQCKLCRLNELYNTAPADILPSQLENLSMGQTHFRTLLWASTFCHLSKFVLLNMQVHICLALLH